MSLRRPLVCAAVVVGLCAGLAVSSSQAQPAPASPPADAPGAGGAANGRGQGGGAKGQDFEPFEKVIEDYEKVVSTSDGEASMYTIYRREKDAQLLAELPRTFDKQRLFVGTTLVGGAEIAGFQLNSQEAYWRRYDTRLALIEPNLDTRSSGDFESQRSRDNIYSDRVLLDVPIATMGPGGGPVIDLDELLVGQSEKFFGAMLKGANRKLVRIVDVKAFPQNIEVKLELPEADGRLLTLHYSLSVLPESSAYKPREADQRVGYFTVNFDDLGDPSQDDLRKRYITRFHLEKADPDLALSPPRKPIVFYIDHKTPIRYRRWVREGVLEWNKAFEKVGIVNAVECYQQDARTGAHMDKDPADVRHNFVIWNSNAASFAIALKRVDPRTGEVLDADVVMQDGWVRAWSQIYRRLIPEVAAQGLTGETLEWLADRPQWDPRVRLAVLTDEPAPSADELAAAMSPAALDELSLDRIEDIVTGRAPGMISALGHEASLCMHGSFKSMDMAIMRLGLLALDSMADLSGEDTPLIDGAPEDMVGAQVKDVVQHEVGHQLGLRHNFKSSTVYDLSEINSEAMRGTPFIASVMDYNPININMSDGPVQGDWTVVGIGPYDIWAIEFGYCDDAKIKDVLARASEPALVYATDEDVTGQDPMAWRHDIGADPLDFCESRIRLVKELRGKLLERAIKDGQSWSKVRDHYQTIMGQHIGAIAIASNWLGASHVNRSLKGDVDGRLPIENADPAQQRRALRFIIDNTFRDEAFGLTPELLSSMTVDRHIDSRGPNEVSWPIHDSVMGMQATALTLVLNPTTLRRVLDNEWRIRSTEDALTLPELLDTMTDAAFAELADARPGAFTARSPVVSSLRRNLQREYVERLIDLSMPGALPGAASKPIATLSALKLREIRDAIDETLQMRTGMDDYTLAHLTDTQARIQSALDAQYIYNLPRPAAGGGPRGG